MPTLDPTVAGWDWNAKTGLWDSAPIESRRSKKVLRGFEKAPATDKHPAQVETYYEDKNVGTWTTVKHSGALSSTRKKQLLDRVATLSRAVKMAREDANSIEAPEVKVGAKLFEYLLAP